MKSRSAVLTLLLISGIVYANSLLSGFVWDDKPLIIKKQVFFSQPESAIRVFALSDAPSGIKTPYYRPLNTLSYMLDHYLWGLHPFWYHLENLLLHALVAVLFYFLLMEAFGDGRLAFLSALLFAVYPINTETVDAVFNRNALFCAFFLMASLLFLARGGVKWTLMSLLAYFLALLSKEPAAVLPLFLFSFRITTKKEKFRVKWNALAGFFGVTAVYFAIRFLVLGAFIEKNGISFSPKRMELVFSILFEHFKLFVFPFMLNAFYTAKAIPFSLFKGIVAISGVLLLLYLSLRRKTPSAVRAGALWIFWGLLPVSGIINVPSAPLAERYQYPVLFGFVLILGYLLSRMQKSRMLAGSALAFLLVLTLGIRTFERNFIWKDEVSLYSSMIRSDPANPLAHYDLGNAFEGNGRLDDAIAQFKTDLDLDPYNVNAMVDLGAAYAEKGDLDKAIYEFKAALAPDPENVMASADLGLAYEKEGLFTEAKNEFQNVLRMDPGNAQALDALNHIESRLSGR